MPNVNLELPEILNLPPRLMPIISDFNLYRYFYLEGGRGSGKTQSVARFLLFLGEERRVRIVCGREIQANIEESVYTVLKDLITEYDLAYTVLAHEIRHKYSGTTIKFKGFREQGSVNIKGLEGVDILWIDEAQSITKTTLDVIIPTIRKEQAKVIFTMNRFMRDDAVPEFLEARDDCLHIKINYFDNPFCPLNLKVEAETMKMRSERDYRHVWLGQPLATADDYLFNYDKLHQAFDLQPFGDPVPRQRVLAIDFAAQGNDQCVGSVLDRVTSQHWKLTERAVWDEADTMASVGKIVALIGMHNPDVTIIDIGGMGKVVYDRLIEVGMDVHPFDGGSTKGIDTKHYVNIRAAAYFLVKEWFDSQFLCLDKKDVEVVRQLEKIKFKYRSNGSRVIQSKVDMKKELKHSPDDADSLMMAVWAAATLLGRHANSTRGGTKTTMPTRKTGTTRKKR